MGPLPAMAAMQSVTESAVYAMSETDSRSDARQKCADNAKRAALDRAGSVFEARLAVDRREGGPDSSQLSMHSTVAGVVGSEIVSSQLDVFGETTRMSCEVRITYDPDTVTRKMADLADAEGLRRQVAYQQATIAALQQQPSGPPPVQIAQGPAPAANAGAPPPSFAPPPTYQNAPVYQGPPAYSPPPVYAPPPPVYATTPPVQTVAYVRPAYYAVPATAPPPPRVYLAAVQQPVRLAKRRSVWVWYRRR
jgi:hypothetical protein